MTWCNSNTGDPQATSAGSAVHHHHHLHETNNNNHPATTSSTSSIITKKSNLISSIKTCPSCGHRIQAQDHQSSGSAGIQDLPGLPSGVKFDPTDQELLEHLEGKARPETKKLHHLIDEFIPTIDGDGGICYTHPERLPGVSRDGLVRHFFHRPSKAYTTGTRKRRKVHSDEQGGETRWHKTGKTRPVLITGGKVKGYKKILVLYTNYGKQRKPEKTNWVMHQYHLGSDEEEKDGELIVSKVFYQTQPRQCSSSSSSTGKDHVLTQVMKPKGFHIVENNNNPEVKDANNNHVVDYYSSSLMIPNFTVRTATDGSSFLQ